jgi:hypothetical protein
MRSWLVNSLLVHIVWADLFISLMLMKFSSKLICLELNRIFLHLRNFSGRFSLQLWSAHWETREQDLHAKHFWLVPGSSVPIGVIHGPGSHRWSQVHSETHIRRKKTEMVSDRVWGYCWSTERVFQMSVWDVRAHGNVMRACTTGNCSFLQCNFTCICLFKVHFVYELHHIPILLVLRCLVW